MPGLHYLGLPVPIRAPGVIVLGLSPTGLLAGRELGKAGVTVRGVSSEHQLQNMWTVTRCEKGVSCWTIQSSNRFPKRRRTLPLISFGK